jgi:hypothetical protein
MVEQQIHMTLGNFIPVTTIDAGLSKEMNGVQPAQSPKSESPANFEAAGKLR